MDDLRLRVSELETELNSAEPNRMRIRGALTRLTESRRNETGPIDNPIERERFEQNIDRQIRRATNFIRPRRENSLDRDRDVSTSSDEDESDEDESDEDENESVSPLENRSLKAFAIRFITALGFPEVYRDIGSLRDLLNDDLATAYWLNNPLINPLTGQRIVENGPKYRDYLQKAEDFNNNRDRLEYEIPTEIERENAIELLGLNAEPFNLTSEERRRLTPQKVCAYWVLYPYYSADTGRMIKIGSTRYIALKEQCHTQDRIDLSRYNSSFRRAPASRAPASRAPASREPARPLISLSQEQRDTIKLYFTYIAESRGLNIEAGQARYPTDRAIYSRLHPSHRRDFFNDKVKCAYFLLFPDINPNTGLPLTVGSSQYNDFYNRCSYAQIERDVEEVQQLSRLIIRESEAAESERTMRPDNPKPHINQRNLSSKDNERNPHDPSKVNSVCSMLFREINGPFKKYGELLQRYCSRVTSASSCKNINEILHNIRQIYANYYEDKIILNIRVGYELEDIFNIYNSLSEDNKKFFFKRPLQYRYQEDNLPGFTIVLAGLPGSGTGLLNQVFVAMVQQIKNLGMFVASEENSGSEPRHFINPDFVYENDRKRLELYRFVGAFYSFCIINNISIDFSLSRAYLYRMLSIKGIEESRSRTSEFLSYLSQYLSAQGIQLNSDKLVTYFLLDFPVEGKSFIYLMQNPSDIPDDFLFNDDYQLLKNQRDKAVTVKTLREYLQLKATHQQFKQIHPGARNTEDLLDAFIEGFQFTNLNEVLLSQDVNIYTLDTMLSTYQLTPEVIEGFIQRISYSPENLSDQKPHKYLEQILRNFGKDFPSQNIEGESQAQYKIRQVDEFKSFFKKLIAFWSGNTRIDANENTRYMLTTRENQGLPTAAMCFKKLRFHIEDISYENFYKKLITAIEYGWSDGTQLAGGA